MNKGEKIRIRDEFGFSLLEIMVVMGIITILLTGAISLFRNVSMSQQTKAAASEMSSLLYQARSIARSTSVPAQITINNVDPAPGGSIQAQVGAPVNWSQTLAFGANTNYSSVGLIGGVMGPFTITPRGTITPSSFTLSFRNVDFGTNNETINLNMGLLGDITVTGP